MRVAIIGAGINGLYLAWKLSEKKENVTVFERRNKIGKEACSGLFSERILEFIPQSRKLIQNEIGSALIHFPKKTLKIIFSKKFLVMDHFKLDNLVASLAKKAGTEIILNHSIKKKEDIFRLLNERFDRAIGCDGANSDIRKCLNLSEPKFRLGIQGFVEKTSLDFKVEENYVDVWPTKKGFIWKIPRKSDIEWGIIEETKKAKPLFDQFLKENSIFLKNIKSALIPKDYINCNNSSIALCGDAAGLVKPWSGGGVVWGLTAAELLLKNFPDFLKYQKALKARFFPKMIFAKIAVRIVCFAGFNFYYLMPKNVKIESDFLI